MASGKKIKRKKITGKDVVRPGSLKPSTTTVSALRSNEARSKHRNDLERMRFATTEEKIQYLKDRKKELRLKKEQLLRQCREDCRAFIQYVMKDDRDGHKGEKIVLSKIHDEVIEHFTKNNRALCIFPREHGKTTTLIGIMLFLIGKNPNIRIKIVCNNEDNAKKRVSEISQYITTDKDFHEVFPHIKPHKTESWTKFMITVERSNISREPTIEACAILSAGTGYRADVLFVDDPVDFKNAILNPAMQPQIKTAFDSVWTNTLSENGKIFYIATLWTKDDLTHHLIKRGSYAVYKRGIGPNFEPVWSEVWPRERLYARFLEIGPVEFDRNFRHKVVSGENRTFDDEIIKLLKQDNFAVSDIIEEWVRYGGLDLAISEKGDAAYTVLVTTAIEQVSNMRTIAEIQRGRYSSPDTAEMVSAQYIKWRHQHIGLEINNYQRSLSQWMSASGKRGVPFYSIFTTASNLMDIHGGIKSMAIEMKSGLWRIPFKGHVDQGLLECNCVFHKLLEELEDWPRGETKDIVMACWLCRETIRKFRSDNLLRVLDFSARTNENQDASKQVIADDDDDDDKYLGRSIFRRM